MVFFNYATMQMAAKIVYYGPGLCGKTTNLHHIYTKTSPQSRGEMVSLETETDRTLFFDLLPIDVGVIGGFKTRLQLYTVPGQVFYNTTRKLVLKGVDGIVFVADSQRPMLEANVESFKNLRENLAEIGANVDEIPLVIQLNKRDLPNIAEVETILDALDPERKAEVVEAIAARGEGVFETLKLISKLTLRTLRRRMTGDEPTRPAPSATRTQFRVQDAGRTRPVDPDRDTAPMRAMGDTLVDEINDEVAAAERAEAPASEPVAPPDLDRSVIADAPVADAPQPEVVATAAAPAAEPDVEFGEIEKPHKDPEVKTVKVRSSVDVMAELEALRKKATSTTPKAPKRDILADLESLRPRREMTKTVHLQVPQDVLPRAKSVRVTLAFEDGEQAVVESREQQVELGDATDVRSLSVNLKIDLA
jgi:signal recognition particle receptor subunit beta